MTTTQTAVTKSKKYKATTAWTPKAKKATWKKKAKTAKAANKVKTNQNTKFTPYEWEFLTYLLDAMIAATKGKTTVTKVNFAKAAKPVVITIGQL